MRLVLAITFFLVMSGVQALAGPSSTFWTPCTIDIQPADKVNIGVDSFLAFGSNDISDCSATDLGPEFGVQINRQLQAEYGFDVVSAPQLTPFFLNAKIGYKENVLSDNAPALQLGFWGFGTKRGRENFRQNIIYLITGKTLRDGRTRLMGAYYVGNRNSLIGSKGEANCNGFMVAMDHRMADGKWILAADYASGDNAVGGGGIGAYYYFTPDISALFGPVWFNDKNLNGSVKMLLQIDFNI